MIKIIIETIPHHDQRYDTVGDWRYDAASGTLAIRVSDLNNWRYETLIAIHELVEAALCSSGNIDQEKVDQFDLNYKGDGEPGDDSNSPYRGPHCMATGIERMLAAVMGVDWKKYEQSIDEKCG